MRLRIDLEIPQWTQWLFGGVALGLVLGVSASRVFAEPIAVKSDWQAGQVLRAADLNAALKTLQDELNRQQAELSQLKQRDCPTDYVRDAAETRFVVCKQGVDQVVKVGTGSSAFWIDRYEAGIYTDVSATGTQYGLTGAPFPQLFPENGEYPDADDVADTSPFYLYAVSLPGRLPSAEVTWFQAQAACRLNGKRLPSGEEWLVASIGTRDPGESQGVAGTCLTNSDSRLARNTGAGGACVSVWGAEDMIGNVWEWTAEWYAAPSANTASVPDAIWPQPYGEDKTYNIASVTRNGSGFQVGFPSAAIRGGGYSNGAQAGRFGLHLDNAPSSKFVNIGFRCVISG